MLTDLVIDGQGGRLTLLFVISDQRLRFIIDSFVYTTIEDALKKRRIVALSRQRCTCCNKYE